MLIPQEPAKDFHTELQLLRRCIETQLEHGSVWCFLDFFDSYEAHYQARVEDVMCELSEIVEKCRATYQLNIIVTSKDESGIMGELPYESVTTVLSSPEVTIDKDESDPTPEPSLTIGSTQDVLSEDTLHEWSEFFNMLDHRPFNRAMGRRD